MEWMGCTRFQRIRILLFWTFMMPGISGIKTCEQIRKISYVPILFLTAKSSENDKIIGFTAGADDYLVKPFSYAELLARIKALLRRKQVYTCGNMKENGPKCVDKKRRSEDQYYRK